MPKECLLVCRGSGAVLALALVLWGCDRGPTLSPCREGERRCSGNTVEHCESGSRWAWIRDCPIGCTGGACSDTAGDGDATDAESGGDGADAEIESDGVAEGEVPETPEAGERTTFPAAGAYAFVPAGFFWMGSPAGCPAPTGYPGDCAAEPGRYEGDVLHQVTITRGFWLKTTEVTQAEWRATATANGWEANPSYFSACGDDCPVEQVNWWDALEYCNALSRAEELPTCYAPARCSGIPGNAAYTCISQATPDPSCRGYRLPTEAEWEYAARAGTLTAYYTGANNPTHTNDCGLDANLDRAGWYCGNAGDKTHPAGRKQANAWGLYDMLGNVAEWTWDWWVPSPAGGNDPTGPGTGEGRVSRGGSWDVSARYARAGNRYHSGVPSLRNYNLGFRPLRVYSPPR